MTCELWLISIYLSYMLLFYYQVVKLYVLIILNSSTPCTNFIINKKKYEVCPSILVSFLGQADHCSGKNGALLEH